MTPAMTTSHIEHQVATAFASDVAHHRMIVKLDHGLYRHLVFEQREHAWNDRFELITAPGSLTITGDRGAHTFRRLTDMFQFFRSNGHEYGINPGYWAEKLSDSGRSVEVYSEHVARARIEEAFTDWAEQYPDRVADYERDLEAWESKPASMRFSFDKPVEPKTVKQLWEMVEEHNDYGAGLAHYEGTRELLDELEKLGVVSDTWEWDLSDWDYHFLHNLHAIAWGVQQYDNAVKTGLHTVRTRPVAWDVPLPTVAPKAPAPRKAKAVAAR